jgi:hypothetical protein
VRQVTFVAAAPSTQVDAFGVRVEIRVGGDRGTVVLDRFPALWEFCSPGSGGPADVVVEAVLDSDPQVCAAADEAGLVSRHDVEDLLQVLTQRITLSAIDASQGRHLMLHAACLADPATGAAAAFVAPGGTGKTTLVQTLGPGRWYVTDETTVVLEDGSVRPYPKPLSVRRRPDSLFKNETAPSSVGLQRVEGDVHLAALCLLDRDDGHVGPPRVETLSTLDGLVALVPQTSHLPEMPRPLQRVAALCESLGGLHRVTYRESADMAGVMDSLLGTSR